MSELRQPGGISMEQSTHSALYHHSTSWHLNVLTLAPYNIVSQERIWALYCIINVYSLNCIVWNSYYECVVSCINRAYAGARCYAGRWLNLTIGPDTVSVTHVTLILFSFYQNPAKRDSYFFSCLEEDQSKRNAFLDDRHKWMGRGLVG